MNSPGSWGIGKRPPCDWCCTWSNKTQNMVAKFTQSVASMRNEIRFCKSVLTSPITNSAISAATACAVTIPYAWSKISGTWSPSKSTQQYNGVYHVLGGIISPLDGIGPGTTQHRTIGQPGICGRNAGDHLRAQSQYPGRYHGLLHRS